MAKKIECNSEIGITIGLIDAIITTARVLRTRMDFNAMICGENGDEHQPVREALKDLAGCTEVRELIGLHDAEAMRIIHDAAELMRKPAGTVRSPP